MNDSTRVDGATYVRLPKVNARSAIALARAILAAMPKDTTVSVKHAAKQVRDDAVALRDARHTARETATPDGDARNPREVDNEADALHAAIHRRLGDYELVAAHDDDTAARAAELKGALYPDGTDFTRGDMYSQWEETEAWWKALSIGTREATLKELVGASYVGALQRVHAEYGGAIGTTKAREAAAPKVNLTTPLAALVSSTQDLALQLVAAANDRSATPAQRKNARAALRPIDDLREANARRSARRSVADNDTTDDDADQDIPNVA